MPLDAREKGGKAISQHDNLTAGKMENEKKETVPVAMQKDPA